MWNDSAEFSPFCTGADDIFVTLDMLNGPYYWDQKDLPEEWEDIFSFWNASNDEYQDGY